MIGGILTWQVMGAVGAGAVVLAVLFFPVLEASDSASLSASEATNIAGEYMASEYGSSSCSSAEFDEDRDVWEVNCSYDDPALCDREGSSISCGAEARISNRVLVNDDSGQAHEPR